MRASRILNFVLTLAAFAMLASTSSSALDNGQARTPPMGWNSWNKFGCAGVNEKVVRGIADEMASNGMKDAGYQYVVIDDCWQGPRNNSGAITADRDKFPSGIKALADYVHSKGLKFGIYTDAGTQTCAGRAGSLGHEYQDAQQYADWGVDYLKEDWCNTLPGQNSKASYALMRNALAATGRPIVFSICEWGSTEPWLWAQPIGNLWRATGDIQDCWDCKVSWGGMGMTLILDQVSELGSYAGPGHWNDLDILEVGNGGMTKEEDRVHFSMWSMLSAPLMAGNDITNMSADTREILLNKEVIAIDQDSLGSAARRVSKQGSAEVWSKQLADGSRAVALLNRGTASATISVSWQALGYPSTLPASVRDIWAKKNEGKSTGSYAAQVPGHGVVMVTVRP
jgi:alpha-galactosidase